MSELRRRQFDAGVNREKSNESNAPEKNSISNEADESVLDGAKGDILDTGVNDNEAVSPASAGVKERLLSTVNIVQFSGKCFGLAFLLWFIGYLGFSWVWLIIGVSILTWRKQRQERKEIASEIHSSIADDEKKFMQNIEKLYKLSGKEFPSWVYFPDVEKAEWLNKMLEQLWPYVGAFVKDMLHDTIEPSIQQSNRLLEGFSFTKVDIGDKAPRISGVKVYGARHTKRSEIIMDLQLVYMSDADIRVAINRLSVGVKDLTIRGLLRVELRPLINSIPLVGAASVSFVQMPIIDFDLTDLGNFFDIPGLDTVIRSAVTGTVSSMMVLPEKYVLRLADDVDVSRLRFPLPKGVIRVHVIEAKNLEEKDAKFLGVGGKSDPYVVVKIGRETEFKTKVINHNVNPIWNERFECPIVDIHTSKVEVSLFDDDGPVAKSEFLGSASVLLGEVYHAGVIDEWIPLSHATRGEVHIRVEWLDLTDNENKTVQAMEHAGKVNLSAALLNVYIDSAKDLPFSTLPTVHAAQSLMDGKYEPSAAVKINMKLAQAEKSFKTKVVENSNNPVWEENYQTLLSNPKNDTMMLRVKNYSGNISLGNIFDRVRSTIPTLQRNPAVRDVANDDETIGTLRLRMNDLLQAPEMTLDQPFSLADSGENSKLQLRACLRLLVPRQPTVDNTKTSFSVTAPSRKADKDKSHKTTHSVENKEETPASVELEGNDNIPASQPTAEEKNEERVASTDESELEFGNSPTHEPNSRKVSRSGSSTSDLSVLDDSRDPRNRLHMNDNNNSGASVFGKLQMKLWHNEKREMLFVEILRGQNLIACDFDDNTSDPYVRIYLLPNRRSSHKRKTKVVKNNLNPIFNETFHFDMMKKDIDQHQLDIAVKNKTGILSTEKALMGQLVIDLKSFDFRHSEAQWYTLKILPKNRD